MFEHGGYLMYPLVFIAGAAFAVALLQLRLRGQRDFRPLLRGLNIGLAALSVAAYAIGMYQATLVIPTAPAADQQMMFYAAVGIAGVPIAWGMSLLVLTSILGGVAGYLHQREVAAA